MDLETLFTEQKWQILYHLSLGENSPLQLAQKTNTTISNISQQLKLLEAAKLVAKKKIPNRDKGKPRSMFSLSNDYAYLISVTKDFTSKKLLNLTDYHKTILKIWSIKNADLHPIIERLYNSISAGLNEFECVYISEDQSSGKIKLNLVYNGSQQAPLLVKKVKSEAAYNTDIEIVPVHGRVRNAGIRNDWIDANHIILFAKNDYSYKASQYQAAA